MLHFTSKIGSIFSSVYNGGIIIFEIRNQDRLAPYITFYLLCEIGNRISNIIAGFYVWINLKRGVDIN